MKNRKIDFILLVIIVGLFLAFFLIDKSHNQITIEPKQNNPSQTIIETPIPEEVFPQQIVVNNYTYEGAKIKLGFVSAVASKEELSVTLSLTGMDFSENYEAFNNLVCVPYISSTEPVKKTFVSYAANTQDPTQITYVYELDNNTFNSLHAEMDWTIGPCGTYLNEGQSNATPFPTELMTNAHFIFTVPVN